MRKYYDPVEDLICVEISEEEILLSKPILEGAKDVEVTLKSGKKYKTVNFSTEPYETIDEFYTYMEAYEKHFKPHEKGTKLNTLEDLKQFIAIAEKLKKSKCKI